jgi:hypothetical protein
VCRKGDCSAEPTNFARPHAAVLLSTHVPEFLYEIRLASLFTHLLFGNFDSPYLGGSLACATKGHADSTRDVHDFRFQYIDFLHYAWVAQMINQFEHTQIYIFLNLEVRICSIATSGIKL